MKNIDQKEKMKARKTCHTQLSKGSIIFPLLTQLKFNFKLIRNRPDEAFKTTAVKIF